MPRSTAERVGFLRKKTGMTTQEFFAHWHNTHAVLCQKLPGLRRYATNMIDRRRYPDAAYDVISELLFDSVEENDAAFASPAGITLLTDIPNFVDELVGVMVEERQIVWP